MCWGDNTYGQTDVPDGEFVSVSAGGAHTCGVLVDGAMECWGDNTYGQASAPEGEFASVIASVLTNCGYGTDESVLCWPKDRPEPTVSTYQGLTGESPGLVYSCGLRDDKTASCHGGSGYDGGDLVIDNVPHIEFATVSTGMNHVCGLRLDGAIECWGSNERGQLDIP